MPHSAIVIVIAGLHLLDATRQVWISAPLMLIFDIAGSIVVDGHQLLVGVWRKWGFDGSEDLDGGSAGDSLPEAAGKDSVCRLARC